MPIDWERLLNDNEVPYVTMGPNTRRGELSIKCPFCGEDDPSEHMGIGTKGWGCLRDSTHRGIDNIRLIRHLLSISRHQASLIAETYSSVDPDAFSELGGLEGPQASSPSGAQAPPSCLPPSSLDAFEEIKPNGSTKRFWNYLLHRGFPDVYRLCVSYGLTCGTTGRFKDRVIIPIFDRSSGLVGWTSRAIGPAKLRYLTSGPEVKRTIYNLPRLTGGPLLAVTEGPFDALKLDYYGLPATATFGTTFIPEQAAILAEVSKLYTKTVIIYDTDAVAQAWALAEWIPGAIIGSLPEGISDPGELSPEGVDKLKKAQQ